MKENKRINVKICSRCKKKYPATLEYFARNKKTRDKLMWCCKSCNNLLKKLYIKKLKSRDSSEIIVPYKKVCSRCRKTKLAKSFYYLSSRRCGLTDWCKQCMRESLQDPNRKKHKKRYRKQQYRLNKEREQADVRKYQAKLRARNSIEILIPKRKKCYRCGKIKGSKKFNRTKLQNSGLQTYCRECVSEINRYRHDKILQCHRRYYRKNKDRLNMLIKNRKRMILNLELFLI